MDRLVGRAAPAVERRRLHVTGVVQGVGFRPLVYRLAVEHGLNGYVSNRLGEVTIEVEGPPGQLEAFRQALLAGTRPPAQIKNLTEELVPPVGAAGFAILPSGVAGRARPVLPPDLALCPACRRDIATSQSRYSEYPFTSCTDCGPRYAAAQALPYDRPNTSMAPFPLCPACRAEYEDPLCRRFHAQTTACPECGPKVTLWADSETQISGDWRILTQQALVEGRIVAVKGLGGFQLICDAAQKESVERLRQRKRRPRKPFAVMVRDAETAARYLDLSADEWAVLQSRQAPILLVRPLPSLMSVLPLGSLAPGHQRLGVMLPYTPLHLMLFSAQCPFLLVTSGNASGLPIARTNAEALEQLAGVADLFVLHDREIVARVEDSVCQWAGGSISLLRRSRGYVPDTISIPLPPGAGGEMPVVLAVGAEQKNSVCLVQGDQAVLGPYMGDLHSAEQIASWWEGLHHLTGLLQAEPSLIAFDPHPGYLVSQEATRCFAAKEQVAVYHHHAHLAAVMAEHGLTGPVIGCILDGTGYGRNGTLWGCETLVGDYLTFERITHLRPILLPGGEAAIRQPWLVAVALYYDMVQDPTEMKRFVQRFFPQYEPRLPFVLAQVTGQIPAPQASSAGRLFDAVATLTGLCTLSSYEGEAAALLGEQADVPVPWAEAEKAYPVRCTAGQYQTAPLLRSLLDDLDRSVPVPVVARKFHRSVAQMVCDGARQARERTGLEVVVLGGGVWQNRYLLAEASKLLVQAGFRLYVPQRVPAGDGGIALGQAVSALWRWHARVSGGTGEGA